MGRGLEGRSRQEMEPALGRRGDAQDAGLGSARPGGEEAEPGYRPSLRPVSVMTHGPGAGPKRVTRGLGGGVWPPPETLDQVVRRGFRRPQCVRRTARGQSGRTGESKPETASSRSVWSQDAEHPGSRLQHPEQILRSNLAKLTLDPAHQPELILSPRLSELTPGSACPPEMTLRPGSTELTLEPVHCRPELLDACADLINEQWPRSRASRLHSLGQSSDNFPLCLMLLSSNPTPGAAPIVVGHARLSRVLDQPQSLLVETVVVARALRGRGFGRCLMEGLEVFAQARGFRRLHLTTHDQLNFYAHLGYRLGEPVQGLVFTSRRLPTTLLSAFPRAFPPRPPCKGPSSTAQSAPRAPKGPSLPPPPPLPEPLTSSSLLPAGALPQNLLETQYCDLRGCPIFWMEKDI
ncbi:N-alpha-acetyltransferase 80 [Rousettus aegyptiacus]|uniref:N-alpha-acetyltransferase 80 n=1 Tax=Rousettus aegyptiacus TaxID=9407 RepID=UPI00168D6C80|nr:N-alpha-acetyltransferase 80 [Rousettus aegyptiacus]